MLSIGELPGGVDPSAVSWVPVRGYSKVEGGLPGPGDSPGEVCFSSDWMLVFSVWSLVD